MIACCMLLLHPIWSTWYHWFIYIHLEEDADDSQDIEITMATHRSSRLTNHRQSLVNVWPLDGLFNSRKPLSIRWLSSVCFSILILKPSSFGMLLLLYNYKLQCCVKQCEQKQVWLWPWLSPIWKRKLGKLTNVRQTDDVIWET